MSSTVRVRFAPSPTGGLHLGGMRTVLYNFLFARKHGGEFVLRIEDTDQSRYVPGAEEYILECLKWCGLQPDESPYHEGQYGPYRQSERKQSYRQYAEQLVSQGNAYYAFDTPEELDQMRERLKTETNPAPQYDHITRNQMRNSITLAQAEVNKLLAEGTPHVIRIRMPENETVQFTDLVRGDIQFETNVVDDKVLLKADGMPTYHLAVVVDDHLMKITHAFRGEEWLPSAPVHLLLWKYLGWSDHMPRWAHLPLIMGPNGKLSKRDGSKYGFPVFAMNWTDPRTNEFTEGFRERGFLPEAFINMLAMLGWNDGTEQELFSLEELIERFSIDRVHKGGAKFDFEKAKWFNHEWIKRLDAQTLKLEVEKLYKEHGVHIQDSSTFDKILSLLKERCTLLPDFWQQGNFFFVRPESHDADAVKPKWNEAKKDFFLALAEEWDATPDWESAFIEAAFRQTATAKNIKPGELQLPLRVMLVGGKFGPPVFDIAEILGKEETIQRIRKALPAFE